VKTLLFYFSGTGNSLKVARDLSVELGETELVSVPQALGKQSPPQADRIGIVFPTYFGGLPLIVARFLKTLRPKGYTFALTTCGGMPGLALKQAAAILQSQGTPLSAGFAVNMPGNYTRLYGAMPARKQQKLFDEQTDRVKQIARLVQAGATHKIEKGPVLLNWLFALLYRYHFVPQAHSKDTLFRVDQRCNGCGVCVQVCPVNNIEMREGKPVWQHRCEQCYGCLQWCPQEAIQSSKKTPKRKRYHHPEVDVQDIIQSSAPEREPD